MRPSPWLGLSGVSDPIRGEIVKAFIVPKEGVRIPDKALEETSKNHVKKRLEAHAYPREVVFLKEMPTTKTGKILKQELRRMHEDRRVEIWFTGPSRRPKATASLIGYRKHSQVSSENSRNKNLELNESLRSQSVLCNGDNTLSL
jgi:hypothetical protein